MRRSVRAATLGILGAVCAASASAQIHGRPTASPGRRPAADVAERYAKAWRDWNAGRYDVSLAELSALLRAPGTDALLPLIAELTGEQYRSFEVAQNARQALWAPDGKHILFQQLPIPFTPGPGVSAAPAPTAPPVFVLAIVEDTVRRVGAISGSGFVFSPDSRRVAYLVARGDQPALVRVRDIASSQDRDVDAGGLTVTQLAWSTDGQSLLGVGAAGDQPAQVVSWSGASGAPATLTRSDSAKANLIVAAGGRHLVYSIVGAAGGGRGGRGGGGGGGGRGRGGAAPGGTFEIFDVAAGTTRRLAGRNVVVARDGSALAYLSGGGAGVPASVMRLSLTSAGEPVAVHRTEFQVQAPAIAPDGSRVAFQQMPREDWEIMVAGASDSVARRLTTEIQHDLSPVFLTPTRVLGLIGEARHRRSYMYDVASTSRARLFHNNTVRTIAPEYEWAPSADGTRVLIGAERDGDTVTPHRHLYCIDLSRPVTRADLVARVDSALTAERALRSFTARAFAPIDTAVRAATAAVDVGRVYEYAQTLFSFGSKHWTQPGNLPAREYLLSLYKSFGYDAKFQTFTPGAGRGGGRGGAGAAPAITETANVVAVLPGTLNPELVYVVGSHFDSVQPGAGADDNSSGTTALLEAARVLATRPQPATIIFVSFTGEEGGLLGSREFVRRARDSLKIVGALNNDMVGFANDERLDNTIRYSNAGIKDIQHAAAIRYSNLITYDAFYYKSTDAAAFFDAYGDIVGGIGSYPVLGNPHYHQSHDVLETINQQLVAEVSRTTVATLMLLASSPSRLTGLAATRGAGGAVDLKWNPSPEKGIVRYVVSYQAPGAVLRQVSVTVPSARLTDVPAGTTIAVRAVNARGLAGWDWARVAVQ